MSLFITFEGGEGCGKSTQARALYNKLSKLDMPAKLIHEPGGTALGNELRHSLKKARKTQISPQAELLLFAASRNQLITEVIRPNLEKGNFVICDRFTDSTTAYQGYGRGVDLATIKAINDLATQGLRPNLTILLDIPAEQGLARRQDKRKDRFEQEQLSFHQQVRQGYLKLAKDEPERWLVIDATLTKAKIAKIIWERVSQLLP